MPLHWTKMAAPNMAGWAWVRRVQSIVILGKQNEE